MSLPCALFMIHCFFLNVVVLYILTLNAFSQNNDSFINTLPLTWQGGIASMLIDSCYAFLLNKIDLSIDGRSKYWNRDFSSLESYEKSIEPNRQHVARIQSPCTFHILLTCLYSTFRSALKYADCTSG